MSQIFDEFRKYRDRFGLNQLHTDGQQGGVEDNGALFTMEYLVCLLSNLKNEDGRTDPERFKETQAEIRRIRQVFAELEPKPGLSVRHPGNWGTDSMDNVGALLTFSALWGDHGFAIRRREHGLQVRCDGDDLTDPRSKKYSFLARVWSTLQLASFLKQKNFWNTLDPTRFHFFGWHGRSPGMMGWLDVCATGHTSWFRALGLWVGQMLSLLAKPGDTDAWKLPYIVWYTLRHRGWVWRLGYRWWVRGLLKKYPGGMRDVYALYYKDPNHPIRRWATAEHV